MKQRMLSILLIFCMAFTMMPVFGASSLGGGGASSGASAYQYGVILEVDDYYVSEGFLEVTILFPAKDSFALEQGVFSVTLSTLFNETLRYTDMDDLYNALPIGTPIRFTAQEGIVGNYGMTIITELWSDTTPVTYDPFNTYNPSTGFEAPSNSVHLPVYRTEQWDDYIYFFAAYLDENHYYSIDAYDYGIFVNGMRAIEEDMYSIDIVELLDTPDKNFTATMDFYVVCDIENATLCAELYNANGNKLQRKTSSIIEYEGSLSFTDVPDTAGTHIIKAWLQRGNQTISPVYEYSYIRDTFNTYSGYITSVNITNNGWQDYLEISLATDDGNFATINCYPPTIVNGTTYNTVSALLNDPLLKPGTYIEMVEGDYTYSIRKGTPSTPEPDIYGVIALARTEREIWNNGKYVMVRIFLPDGTYRDCSLSTDLTKNIADLDAYCESLIGSCGIFAGDENGTVVAMELDSTGILYENKRYQESKGTFSGLSSSTAELPIYYLVDGNYEAPVLNEDALYDIPVYDYGIVITDVKYVEINVLSFYPEINLDFTQDINIAYGIWDDRALGYTLHVQLLDDKYKILEEESVEIVDGNSEDAPDIWFRNYPNENLTYHIRAWITDENGERVSSIYTENSFDYLAGRTVTVEQEIKSGIVVSENKSTHPNTVKIQIKSSPNGIQTTEYVTFGIGTNVNGKTFASAAEFEAALPVGTLIEYVAGSGNYSSIIRFSTSKQQVVTDASYDATEKKVSATVTLVSNDTTAGTSAIGTVYAGVYSKEGLLKGITTVPETALSADGTATTVPVTIEGVTCEKGDYIKAFYWTADNAAISNAAEWGIE
ncbi:MAG: hypothetical protein J6A56_01705 [Clostridia bacterium]|nr:hypothetical protein [Clostridia bacterium]